jgi:hypothetical protein
MVAARPDPTDRTEAPGQERTHLRMAKADDLIKQIVLTIVARLAHGFPPTANLLSKRITNR